MEMIMKTFVGALIVGASLMLPFAAWAQVQNAGPNGSTGANSVGSSFTSPGPSAGASGASSGAGASTQVQNAGPDGSTGANNVGGLATPSGAGNNAGQSAGRAAQPGRIHQ
jgi:hypothetical protein